MYRGFEAWTKLAQQCLITNVVCAPLGRHLDPSDNIIIINSAFWSKERPVCHQIRSSLGQCSITYMYMYISVFDKLIWHTIGPMSFFIGTAQFSLWAIGAANYDYIVTNSFNALLIGSRCTLNGTHPNHF